MIFLKFFKKIFSLFMNDLNLFFASLPKKIEI